MYPSPLPEDLGDVDTHLLAHLLQQVGLTELLQRAQGNWMLSQDWQGSCHAICLSHSAEQTWWLRAHLSSALWRQARRHFEHEGCMVD